MEKIMNDKTQTQLQALAEDVGGTGRDLMLGVALGYTVQSRLVDHGNFMTHGFDDTAQLAFSHNAAASGCGFIQ
jgi:2-methylcitrate dehydratase PrpD